MDADACPKGYPRTRGVFYILMETPTQQAEDKLAAERKIRRNLQRQLQLREDEILPMQNGSSMLLDILKNKINITRQHHSMNGHSAYAGNW